MRELLLIDNRFALSEPDLCEVPLPAEEVRRCQVKGCGARLRATNRDTICATCERRQRLGYLNRKRPQPATADVPLSESRMDLYWRNLTADEKYLLLDAAANDLRREA